MFTVLGTGGGTSYIGIGLVQLAAETKKVRARAKKNRVPNTEKLNSSDSVPICSIQLLITDNL